MKDKKKTFEYRDIQIPERTNSKKNISIKQDVINDLNINRAVFITIINLINFVLYC